MSGWKRWILPTIKQGEPALAPGIHHFQRETADGLVRYHFRVEPNGEALLIANASEAVRLSTPAARIAKRLLAEQQAPEPIQWADATSAAFVEEVEAILSELGRPSGRFPIFNLMDPLETTRDAALLAPFQADLVVASSDQACPLLKTLWAAGIPHVRLLPETGLATEEISRAIECAEDLGMITGVRISAGWLNESDRMSQLAERGLDYVVFPWGGSAARHQRLFGEPGWEALSEVSDRIRECEMTPVAEIGLSTELVDGLDDQLSRLLEFDLSHLEVYAIVSSGASSEALSGEADVPLPAEALRQLAAWIEEIADSHPWQIIWLPPVEWAPESDLTAAVHLGPRAGGDVSIRVESNGDVLPPRGPANPAGNLGREKWRTIWQDDVFRRFRQRVESNTRCQQCPGLAICAADCPSDPLGWATCLKDTEQE